MQRRRWTEEEDAIIRENYPFKGIARTLALLPPYRTRGSLSAHAVAMGLNAPGRWAFHAPPDEIADAMNGWQHVVTRGTLSPSMGLRP
jgi:hypothetical protein